MKFLFLSALMMSFSSYAMLKKASIDGALSNRYDKNYEETQRSLASQIEKPEKAAVETDDKDVSKDAEGARVPSSKGESFDDLNENGIRYWKY